MNFFRSFGKECFDWSKSLKASNSRSKSHQRELLQCVAVKLDEIEFEETSTGSNSPDIEVRNVFRFLFHESFHHLVISFQCYESLSEYGIVRLEFKFWLEGRVPISIKDSH